MPPRSSQDVDEEGFTKVSTIRYKTPVAPAKPKKHRKGRGKPAQAEESDELTRSQKVEVVLEGRRASLLEGVWGTAWIALIDRLLAYESFPRLSRIICFGLGSLENSRIAQLQLLLMLDVSKRLNITSIEAYDPAFTPADELLLKSYSISVLPANTHGHHSLPSDESTTLIYMPHCPRTLYQNLLFSNWSEDALGRLVLLSNDLSGYVVREPLKKLQALAPSLPLIVPHLETHLLPPNFPPNDVFNDLAFHWLPKEKVSRLGEGERGWERPGPMAEEEEMDEII